MEDDLDKAINIVSNIYIAQKGTINLNKIIDDSLYINKLTPIIVENFECNNNLLAVIYYESNYIGIFNFDNAFDVDFVQMMEL